MSGLVRSMRRVARRVRNDQRPQPVRVTYGARCSWWGLITEAATRASGLPCCPHCHGVLFEVADEATWWAGVDAHEANGLAGYRAFIEWLRGRCFPSVAAARDVWEAQR